MVFPDLGLTMSREQLTRKQKELVKEIEEIYDHFNLDYYNIQSYERDGRTPYLVAARDKVVRGQVVIWYTLVDEFLTNVISRYYFGKLRSFPELWRTKKFKNFQVLHYRRASLDAKIAAC